MMTEKEIKARIKLWIPHVRRLAEDYAFYMNSEPVHQDLLDDMLEVAYETI